MAARLVALGAALVALGIILGAFGAHALSAVLDQHGKEIYEKAVFYHLINALGIILVGILFHLGFLPSVVARRSGIILALGILLFSGSLYLYAVTGVRFWAMTTPFGGISLIVGWTIVAFGAIRITTSST